MGDFDTAAAIAQANKWTEAGAHLVRVYLGLDRLRGDTIAARAKLIAAYDPKKSPHIEGVQALDEADDAMREANENVLCSIRDLRSLIVGNVMPPQPQGDDEDEWTQCLAIQQEIETAVISVGAFIKKMEMEA